MPNLTANISTPIQIKADITIGKEKIYPPLQSKEVVPSGETQVVVPDSEYYGLDKVTVGAISLQNKSITPTTSEQVISADEQYSGLNEVTVEPVTSEIDSNIQPSNIKEGVTILGVTGTLENPDFVFNVSAFQYMDQKSVDEMIKHTNVIVDTRTFYNSTMTELNLIKDIQVNSYNFVDRLNEAFYMCKNLERINSNGFKIKFKQPVSSLSKLFGDCVNLKEIDLGILDCEYDKGYLNVTDLFYNCESLVTVKGLHVNSISVTDMFKGCTSLVNVLFDGTAISPDTTSDITINMTTCTSLTDESISNMLDSLGANESGRNRTFKLSSQTTALLTDETKQKATSKNYILA